MITVESHLRFALPTEEEARYIFENDEAYLEYITFDAFLGEYLAHFVPAYSRADVTSDKAMQYMEEAMNHPATEPVRQYLKANRATLIRLKAEYEIQEEVGRQLFRRFLDDSLQLSARFSHAMREKDFEIIRDYLEERQSEESEQIDSTVSELRNIGDIFERAKEIARSPGSEIIIRSPDSEIIIHRKQGEFRERRSYRNDPQPPKG